MNYLRKKLQAIMACADFKGYLREVTGYPLTLTDCMGSDLVSLSVTGNAVQNGTPSPDAPVEVQGVGERTGNLLDAESIVDTTEDTNMEIIEYSGRRCLTWIDNANTSKHLCMEGQFKENTQYTFAFTGYSEKGMTISIIYTDGTSSSLGILGGSWNTVYKQTLAGKTVSYWKGSHNYGQHVYLDLANSQILEGSYTTDTMPPFEPYGYKVPLKISGINRLSDIIYTKNTNGSAEMENSIIHIHSSSAGEVMWFWMNAEVEQGKTYTIHCTNTSLSALRYGFSAEAMTEYSSDVYADNTSIQNRHATFTATESGVLRIVFNLLVNTPDGTIEKLQVVEGTYTADTMPAYEPYHEPQAVNVYADKPLYAVGDVGDTITLDFDAKTATRTENVGSFTFNGSETWNLSSSVAAYNGDKTTCRYNATTGLNGTYTSISGFCDRLPYKTGAIWGMNIAEECFAFNSNQVHMRLSNDLLGITSDDDSATRTAKFKAWLSANATTVLGKRATPTTTDISALQNWDAIPSTWRGTVVISADTSVPPSSMAAKYYATKKED